MAAESNPFSHVIQHPLVKTEVDLGPFSAGGEITLLSDQITMIILAGLLLTLFLPRASRKRRTDDEVEAMVPKGFANGLEAICGYLRKEVAEPALGEHTDRFIKYIWSVFFFVLTMNLLGLVPIASVMPWLTGLHIGGTATANIWVTGTLALTTLVMQVVNGIRLAGKEYFKHFNPGPAWLAFKCRTLARAPAATAGGKAVVKMKSEAKLRTKSISALEAAI